jgi:SET domain-containing protein
VNKKSLASLAKPLRKLYDDFAVIKDDGKKYGCPRNFNLLTLAWYLSESKDPNVECGKNNRFFALRDIKAGEELTVNHATYSESP